MRRPGAGRVVGHLAAAPPAANGAPSRHRVLALTPMDLLLLGVLAVFAGFVDAIVGGGGLIQLPALFGFYPGVAPALLLGTNKTAAIAGTAVAAARYLRRVPLPWAVITPAIAGALVFSFLGAQAVAWLPRDVVRPLVLGLLDRSRRLHVRAQGLRGRPRAPSLAGVRALAGPRDRGDPRLLRRLLRPGYRRVPDVRLRPGVRLGPADGVRRCARGQRGHQSHRVRVLCRHRQRAVADRVGDGRLQCRRLDRGLGRRADAGDAVRARGVPGRARRTDRQVRLGHARGVALGAGRGVPRSSHGRSPSAVSRGTTALAAAAANPPLSSASA